ncbi:MAG: MliC family protein [Mesorhizobium sp.]|nr:MliC family protein [Mesorhizobium sp.]
MALGLLFALVGPSAAVEANFTCSGGTKVRATFSDPNVSPGSVVLVFSDAGQVTLPQVMSADGGRYAADNMEFWTKGQGATLTMNGKVENCEVD